jgi:hypothetical protein
MQDFTFKPGLGMGPLELTLDPEHVELILGKPEETEEIVDDANANGFEERTLSYEYPSLELSLQFFYYDNIFEGFQIFTGRLDHEGQDLLALQKPAVIEVLRQLHVKLGAAFTFQRTEEEGEEYLFYPTIGLTMWFEGDTPTDACVSAKLTPDQLDDLADELETE